MALHLTRNRQLYMRIEATPGTYVLPSPPVTADVVAEAFDIDISPEWEEWENTSPMGFFGRRPGVVTRKPGRISFKIMVLTGGTPLGTVPAGAQDRVWKLLGLEETIVATTSVTYDRGVTPNPFSMAVWLDGVLWKMSGCRANGILRGTAGEPLILEVEAIGKWEGPTTQASPVTGPSIPATALPVPFRSDDFLVYDLATANFKPVFNSYQFDLGNETVMRTNANDATGYETAIIPDAKPMLTLDPEMDHATLDWLAAANTKALKTFNAIHDDQASGGRITINIKGCPMAPTWGERDGIVTQDLKFGAYVATTDAVGADFSIVFV